ncbi:hypothetical protein LTR84_009725 [Exophiala bonariae]|uniref:HpcH/HpaI aldolase/citrate lyase domain-containing protein n=1 Tax=Exophiala bonariae TaxID=1690606 RepID=A0AAV9NJ40_9EURO|nr:hypothetical protein LTR84_009725 [Exophiala bonariae]
MIIDRVAAKVMWSKRINRFVLTKAAAGSLPFILRLPAGESWLIKRALDCGAHGLLMPMCETKEQAPSGVCACRHPDVERCKDGLRGTGAMFSPANFNQDGSVYLMYANQNITLKAQIEAKKAVDNMEALAAVDSKDALFVRLIDLAYSIGFFCTDKTIQSI